MLLHSAGEGGRGSWIVFLRIDYSIFCCCNCCCCCCCCCCCVWAETSCATGEQGDEMEQRWLLLDLEASIGFWRNDKSHSYCVMLTNGRDIEMAMTSIDIPPPMNYTFKVASFTEENCSNSSAPATILDSILFSVWVFSWPDCSFLVWLHPRDLHSRVGIRFK